MIAIKGYIRGNTVTAQDESLRQLDGQEVLVSIDSEQNAHTIEKYEEIEKQLRALRGHSGKVWSKDATTYIRNMRDNDRL